MTGTLRPEMRMLKASGSIFKEEVCNMDKLENWTEVTKGLYRYVIAANACYELHILYHLSGDDILVAKASLFIVGDWKTEEESRWHFERECLLKEQPVFECLKVAAKDNAENNG